MSDSKSTEEKDSIHNILGRAMQYGELRMRWGNDPKYVPDPIDFMGNLETRVEKLLDQELNKYILAELEDLSEWESYYLSDELKRRIRDIRSTLNNQTNKGDK